MFNIASLNADVSVTVPGAVIAPFPTTPDQAAQPFVYTSEGKQQIPGTTLPTTLDTIGKIFANVGAAAPGIATAYESFKKPPNCLPGQIPVLGAGGWACQACPPGQTPIQDPMTAQWKCQEQKGGMGFGTNWGTIALVGGGFIAAGLVLYLVLRKK